jgi:small subunit ribosomal protein S3Ae
LSISLIIFLLNSIKEEIGKKVQKECYKIFPLEDNCMVRKVKILKKPKFDLTKLMELYKDRPEEDKKTSGNTLAE